MFELIYSGAALKMLKELDVDAQDRILKSLERIRIKPVRYLKKLVSSPYYRLRVGDYQVIIRLKDKELQILVVRVGHRKNVYD